MTNTNKLLADFNRYFTSGNDVDVPERVSVPRDEWRELHAALAQPAQPSHAVAAIRARLAQEEGQVPKRSDKQDDDFASGLRSGLRIALEMLEAEAQPARVVTHEQLTDLIAEKLSAMYHCTRVWDAWNVGTMSQDDFEDVGESDTPSELAQEVLDLLSTHTAVPTFDATAKCSPTLTQCPRCNNPHSVCDQGAAPAQERPKQLGTYVRVNSGALQMVRNALKRDAEEGKQSRREMLEELDKVTYPIEQQQAGAAEVSDEQRMQLFTELYAVKADNPSDMFKLLVQAVERAHGITEPGAGGESTT